MNHWNALVCLFQWFSDPMIQCFNRSPMLIPVFPKFRKRQPKSKPATQAAAPIDQIARVTVQPDGKTIDIFFTPGSVVTAVNEPGDNFFVNYSGGQTSGSTVTIVSPAQVRIVLSDVIDSPALQEHQVTGSASTTKKSKPELNSTKSTAEKLPRSKTSKK